MQAKASGPPIELYTANTYGTLIPINFRTRKVFVLLDD